MCPWSWYITTTTSYWPAIACGNTESAGTGPVAAIPSARASSTAGPISASSSVPISPPSPACGLSAATPMRGSPNPHSRKCRSVSRIASSTFARVT